VVCALVIKIETVARNLFTKLWRSLCKGRKCIDG